MSALAAAASPSGTGRVLAVGVALAAFSFAFALPGIDALGLYYDEAFLAQQARDFVEPGRESTHPASVREVELFGRPFPIRNAAYLGSLKSQLLIPVFLAAGATPEVLRAATFATAWLALLCTMAWTARLLSPRVAIWTGVLLATDPAFHFFGRFEWGPFTTNFLCRSAGLLALVIAWQSPSPRRRLASAAGGGVALGLGVYSRADFALIVAALGLAALIGHRSLIAAAWRERRGPLLAAVAGATVTSAPMWISALSILGSTPAMADRGDLAFRAGVLWSVLDGSQFHRLMQTGGLFDVARSVTAPAGWLGHAVIAAGVIVGADLLAAARRDPAAGRRDPRRLVWIATLAIAAMMLALPGAVRAHHQLNVLPFVHVLVACAFDVVWRHGAARPWLRGLAVVAGLALVAGNLRTIGATEDEIASTGGRGRWTRALHTLAADLSAESGAEAVSLDWGFHEPLLFLTDTLPLDEPIWRIPRALAAGRPWVHAGDGSTRYLVHEAPWDLFGLGPRMLAAARAQPADRVAIEPWTDRTGAVAFYTIRILRPHRLVYTGRFRIE